MKKLIFLLSLIIIFGCSKDDPNTTTDESPYHQNPEIAENVIVLLDENIDLLSSEADLSKGIYTIEFNNAAPSINSGDIIVANEGDGFLRKVISVSNNSNTLTIQTSQASLDDLFNNATIEFTTDISENTKLAKGNKQAVQVNYLRDGVTILENGMEYNFSNTTLYDDDGLTFKITNGTATFDPIFSFKSKYSLLGGLDFLDFKTNSANLTIDCDLSLNSSGSASLPEFKETLADFDKKISFLVAGLPVVVAVNTQLVAELNAGVDANVLIKTGFSNSYSLTTGVKYENDNWTGNFDLGSALTPKSIDFSGQINMAQNLTITPRVSVKFYNVIGPYSEPKMTEDFRFNIASPTLDWDSDLKVGLELTTGIDITIFGKDVADFSRTDNFEEIIWNAPETLEIVSGNNQTGHQKQQLPEFLKIIVKDKLGNPLRVVPVYFSITSGNGTVDKARVMTDEYGHAEVLWSLGDQPVTQTVEVKVKKANGNNIANGAVTFKARIEEIDPPIGTWESAFIPVSIKTVQGKYTHDNCANSIFSEYNIISEKYKLVFSENGELCIYAKSRVNELNINTTTLTCEETFNSSIIERDYEPESACFMYTYNETNNELVITPSNQGGIDSLDGADKATLFLTIVNNSSIEVNNPLTTALDLWDGKISFIKQ